jgi:hypothetical protein
MGLFDHQKLFRGQKLTDYVSEGEVFVLYDLAVVAEGNTELVPGSTVDKTELVVAKDGDQLQPVLVSTLSGPIRDLAYKNVRDKKGDPVADDLPCTAVWKRVDTKNNFENQATVLDMIDVHVGKAPSAVPAFSFPPITMEDNPL